MAGIVLVCVLRRQRRRGGRGCIPSTLLSPAQASLVLQSCVMTTWWTGLSLISSVTVAHRLAGDVNVSYAVALLPLYIYLIVAILWLVHYLLALCYKRNLVRCCCSRERPQTCLVCTCCNCSAECLLCLR